MRNAASRMHAVIPLWHDIIRVSDSGLEIPAAWKTFLSSSGDLNVLSALSTCVKAMFLLPGIDPCAKIFSRRLSRMGTLPGY